MSRRLFFCKPWLTLARRVYRLCVATINPSNNLQKLTHFIVTNYSPNWFLYIKTRPNCTDGPRHIFQLFHLLPPDVQNIVKPYITRNAYFAHSENILLAMLADSDNPKRCKVCDNIMSLRHQKTSSQTTVVRQFHVPTIPFDATDRRDLIDWFGNKYFSEPPLTMILSEQILELHNKPLNVPEYPNHTHSVERTVKVVSGFIRAKILSRNIMTCYDSK